MPVQTIRLLHVEDDLAQRRFLSHHLSSIGEYHFEIISSESEDAALVEFNEGGVDFVILDYHLTQGNGLSCLEELRRRDRIVPIIAVSGVATPEIAAELLQAGADDFISKRDLSDDVLARSVRDALARANAWRQRTLGRVQD